MLKSLLDQCSNLGRFKTQFTLICHYDWCNFKNSQQSNREMCSAMPRAGRRPTVVLRNSKELLRNPKQILEFLASRVPFGSENSHFFK
jgi:hypothetical protein